MKPSRKVLILDENLLDVMEAENSLSEAGYEVTRLSSPHGCIAKIDYERPDFLLIDITMGQLNAEDLFLAVRENIDHDEMIVVIFSDLDAEMLQSMCVEHDFHGYFCKSMGTDQVGPFLNNFYQE